MARAEGSKVDKTEVRQGRGGQMAEAQTGAHRRERGQSVARTVGQVEGAGHLPAARHRSGRKVTARAHANLEG